MLSAIGSFFSKLFSSPNGRTFLIAAVAVWLLISKFQACNALKEMDRLKEQNLAALKDMETVKNKNGELSYQRALFEGTAKDLKKSNDSLYQALKAEKGNVKIITIVNTKWTSPTISMDNLLIALNDSTKGLKWSNKSPWYTIEGMSTFGFKQTATSLDFRAGTTTISKNELLLSLVTGLKEEDGVYKIFITPKTPGVVITNIEGAIIDKKTLLGNNVSPLANSSVKRGGIGIHIGLGVMPLLGSNGIRLGVGPVISIGYQYHVFRF